MNGMRIVGDVDKAPDLDAIERRILGDGLVPTGAVQKHGHHRRGSRIVFIASAFERQEAGLHRVLLAEFW